MFSQLVKIEKQGPYTIFITDNKVIAVSHFAGKSVRGVAKCSPEDEFNEEFGVRLAVLRCAIKVEKRRLACAEAKYTAAFEARRKACAHFADMKEYLANSRSQLDLLEMDMRDIMYGA